MKIIINGKETVLENEVSIKELLEKEYVEMQEYVTVQVNEDIISRDNYETHIIKDGDTVEFLYYMGGGSVKFSNACFTQMYLISDVDMLSKSS
jgi:sulfur carrier protein